RFKDMEGRAIPSDLDYTQVKGLSIECRQKLAAVQPENLGQAIRISGVTPAGVTCLMIYLHQKEAVS
ncbi:MAG: tRNA uridine-5-carboxymethylaminomethyl(34) synthesis enzyme MnmG, partial [Mariprofundaceae bacterium]|nr:tRNA uridine-5-carboxymethylaminomethyl(34) synthesis enzyme MnmG [Mariprofundaceae bacterium]